MQTELPCAQLCAKKRYGYAKACLDWNKLCGFVVLVLHVLDAPTGMHNCKVKLSRGCYLCNLE